MYAIAKSGGKQFKIQPQTSVRVPTLDRKVGEKVRLEEILLLCDEAKIEVGTPLVEGAYAEATVVRHGRTRKVRFIKYKRRKNYRRTVGFRQGFTELEVEKIVLGKKKKQAAEAEKAKPVEEIPAAAKPETAHVEVTETKPVKPAEEKAAKKAPAAKAKLKAEKAAAKPARKTAAKAKPAAAKEAPAKPAAKKAETGKPEKKAKKTTAAKKPAAAKPARKSETKAKDNQE